MALFSLLVKLGVDKSGFDAGLKQAGTAANAFSKQVGSNLAGRLAAAFTVAAISNYTRHLIKYASQIKDASEKTGAGSDALETLGHAAKLTGSDLDAVAKSFTALSKSRAEALGDPGSKAAQVFKALNIDGEKLKSMRLEDLFREIGRGFEGNDFGASELAMVTELLGKAGSELLPMFKQGLDALEESARRSGVVIGGAVVDQLDEVGDQLDTLEAQLRGPLAATLVALLSLLNKIFSYAKSELKDIVGFIFGFIKAFERAGGLKIPGFIVGPRPKPGQQVPNTIDAIKAGIKGGKDLVAFDKVRLEELQKQEALKRGERPKRKALEFNFENLLREQKDVARAGGHPDSDALGRIGGTVGAGDAVQTKLTELVREIKELRRLHEFRGIAIKGEL